MDYIRTSGEVMVLCLMSLFAALVKNLHGMREEGLPSDIPAIDDRAEFHHRCLFHPFLFPLLYCYYQVVSLGLTSSV